ncbi:ABC-F family ATP-binding cassette domain-containing protein [Nosocomiicoccus sp. HMSC059G07]|uniref:ABC-F family ATP-binding cassette domain-containing protein n=1 Tax=Nosocomiicoccus sp. HMSC059G07 TaxID=1739531 RepID=UPI001438BEC2|nr:ABC-F family ATP-binding cassette domain-containing protein [Nosocomiicoccus sp. HMSC059G07]
MIIKSSEMNLMELSNDLLYRPFYSLSGGEQTKFLLLELFLDKNSFPLIDEPTNNLDLSGRKLVAEYLNSEKGYIVISHDYNFLNSFIDHTLSLNRNNIDLIKGNIETWKYEKNNYDNLTLEKNKKLKDEISRLEKISRTVSDWGEQKERTSKDAFDKKKAAKHMKRSKAILKRTEEKIEQKKRLIHNIETTKDIDINMETARHQI